MGQQSTFLSANNTAPAEDAVAVTKADADLPNYPTRALYIGTAGDVVVQMASRSTPVTFKSVPAGTTLVIRARQVRNATTAADIVALY